MVVVEVVIVRKENHVDGEFCAADERAGISITIIRHMRTATVLCLRNSAFSSAGDDGADLRRSCFAYWMEHGGNDANKSRNKKREMHDGDSRQGVDLSMWICMPSRQW